MVTHKLPLSEAQRALELSASGREGCVKAMLYPDAAEAPGVGAAEGGAGGAATVASTAGSLAALLPGIGPDSSAKEQRRRPCGMSPKPGRSSTISCVCRT